jgi:hypothetical protein
MRLTPGRRAIVWPVAVCWRISFSSFKKKKDPYRFASGTSLAARAIHQIVRPAFARHGRAGTGQNGKGIAPVRETHGFPPGDPFVFKFQWEN